MTQGNDAIARIANAKATESVPGVPVSNLSFDGAPSPGAGANANFVELGRRSGGAA